MYLIFVLHSWLVSSFTTYFMCFYILPGIYCTVGQSSGPINARLTVKDTRPFQWFLKSQAGIQLCDVLLAVF